MPNFKYVILLFVILKIAQAREWRLHNKLPGEIWVGCQGNPGYAHLNNGGWKMAAGQRMTVQSPDNWRGRFWARTWCNSNNNQCLTGSCGNRVQCQGAGGVPPASLVEVTLKGASGLDFYDVSMVDGFNVEISVEPIGGRRDGGQYSCKKCACNHRILPECPAPLRIVGPNGQTVGCNSACNALNTDQYCCRGRHSTPETCRSSDWPVDYPKFFKDRCPDAYSYAYDDHKSTFTCRDPPAYQINFGV